MSNLTFVKKELLLATAAVFLFAGSANALDLGGTLQGVTGTAGNITASSGQNGSGDNNHGGALGLGLGNATHVLGGVHANNANTQGEDGNDAVSGLNGLIGADSNSLVSLQAQDKALDVRAANANKLTLQGTVANARSGNNTLSNALDNSINLNGFEQADRATVKNGKIVLGTATATDIAAHADDDSAHLALGLGAGAGAEAQSETR